MDQKKLDYLMLLIDVNDDRMIHFLNHFFDCHNHRHHFSSNDHKYFSYYYYYYWKHLSMILIDIVWYVVKNSELQSFHDNHHIQSIVQLIFLNYPYLIDYHHHRHYYYHHYRHQHYHHPHHHYHPDHHHHHHHNWWIFFH